MGVSCTLVAFGLLPDWFSCVTRVASAFILRISFFPLSLSPPTGRAAGGRPTSRGPPPWPPARLTWFGGLFFLLSIFLFLFHVFLSVPFPHLHRVSFVFLFCFGQSVSFFRCPIPYGSPSCFVPSASDWGAFCWVRARLSRDRPGAPHTRGPPVADEESPTSR